MVCCRKTMKCLTPRSMISFCCSSRKKVLVLFTALSIVGFYANMHVLLVDPMSLYYNYSLTKEESYHLLQDVPESQWKFTQKRVKDIRIKQRNPKGELIVPDPNQYKSVSEFCQSNLHAELSCPYAVQVGGSSIDQSGKYICNPNNIAKASKALTKENGNNGCLIYTSTGNFHGYKFELELQNIIGKCEIHIFSPNGIPNELHSPKGVHIHPWGFKGSSNEESKSDLKTL